MEVWVFIIRMSAWMDHTIEVKIEVVCHRSGRIIWRGRAGTVAAQWVTLRKPPKELGDSHECGSHNALIQIDGLACCLSNWIRFFGKEKKELKQQ